MELKQYAAFLQRWWWLIVACAVGAGAIAFVAQLRETPLYAASTTILVDQSRATREAPNMDELRTRERLALTYSKLLTTRPVMEAAIADLGIAMPQSLLAARTAVESVPSTELLVLTVRDPDPEQAANLANAITRAFTQIEGDMLNDPYTVYRQTLSVVEPATPRYSPVSPNIPRTVLLAMAVGALLATAAGYLIGYFDDRLRAPVDVARAAGLTTLTSVPQIRSDAQSHTPLLPAREPSPAGEAYRVLRAQVDGTAGGEPIRSLAVVSAAPAEGKTTTAINLGIALAQAGMRVVVVDANMRKPAIHNIFQRPASAGLSAALQPSRTTPVLDMLAPTVYERLYLLPTGAPSANPAGLLVPARLTALLDDLKQYADLVIFDTPALLSVADGALVAGLCDAAAVVVRAGVTREGALKSAVERLAQSGAQVLGAILNQAAPTHAYATYYGGGGAESAVGAESARPAVDPSKPAEGSASKAQAR